MPRLTSLIRHADPRTLIVFFGCFAMYYFVYARYYLSGEIVHGSDTHGMWTVEYLAFYSIAKFGEFSWWDPTGINGWPIYSNLLNWTFNCFSPYALPYLVGFKIVSLFRDISPQGINQAIVVQKVVYFFLLNFAAVMLISREILKTHTARTLVAIAFTLSVIQFQGFRDSHQYMALPGPLFYIWALIYYDRRRTFKSFLVFTLFTGMFVSSLSYAFTQSAVYWTVGFTVLLLVFQRTLLSSFIGHIREAWQTRSGKLVLLAGFLLIILGLAAPLSSVALNVGHLMRVTGSRPLNWSDGIFGDWIPPYFGVPSYELWTNVMYFAARSEIHDLILKFDPYNSGIDHRYVGLVVLPLLFAALVIGHRQRYFGPLFLTFFVCVVFIPYTINNLAYFSLMHFEAFQNVRTMGGLLPRDGPALFLILIAAIGLDQLLCRNNHQPVAGLRENEDRSLGYVLVGCLVGLLAIAVASFFAALMPSLKPLRSVLMYTALYLGLFSLLTLLLYVARSHDAKRTLSLMLLVLTITDLILSGSYYFIQRPRNNMMIYTNVGTWSKPAPQAIGPITDESQSWAGKGYRGIMHNLAGGPWVGLREWLILEGRPAMESLLENWDRKTKFMRAYPYFRFYTAGRFISYEKIKSIDGIEVPDAPGKWVYVHDPALAESPARPAESVDVAWHVETFTLNTVRVKVSVPKDTVMVYFDNFDKYWTAYVDGARVPIYRANFTYKAIKLPAGEHRVEWHFNPYPVKIAWVLFYLALIGYIFLAWRHSWRKAPQVET